MRPNLNNLAAVGSKNVLNRIFRMLSFAKQMELRLRAAAVRHTL